MRQKIKTIIWDLDNTLYKFDDNQIEHWHESVSKSMMDKGVDLPFNELVDLAEKGWLEHRNSNHYFIEKHNICPKQAHAGMFEFVDHNNIDPCDFTPSLMADMRQYHHVILTYATKAWAHRVLDHTGLSQFFEPEFILGAEDYNFEDKAHSPRGILTALDKVGGNADEMLFVEDTLPNLITAKQHTNINTAYLHQGRPINNNEMDDIDICVEDTPELLRWFKEHPVK